MEMDIANLTLKHLLLIQLYADPEFASQFKYDSEDISTLELDDFSSGVSPYDSKHTTKMIREAIKKGISTFEWQAKDKDRNIFWVEFRSVFKRRSFTMGFFR